MKIRLKPDTVLVEPKRENGDGLWHPDRKEPIGVVRQTALEDVSVGDEVLYYAQAGLGIKSGDRRFLLLGAADILAVVEVTNA